MKKALLLVLLALCASTLVAGAFLDYFRGNSNGDSITLEWKTRTESNVRTYEVQRKTANGGDFVTIGSLDPKGSNSQYQFVDRGAYKNTGNVYIYRLRIVDDGMTSFSNEISVSHNATSVKRTWGSIKAMFR